MYRPVFNLVTGVYRRFRFVQSSHQSVRTVSPQAFFWFLFFWVGASHVVVGVTPAVRWRSSWSPFLSLG